MSQTCIERTSKTILASTLAVAFFTAVAVSQAAVAPPAPKPEFFDCTDIESISTGASWDFVCRTTDGQSIEVNSDNHLSPAANTEQMQTRHLEQDTILETVRTFILLRNINPKPTTTLSIIVLKDPNWRPSSSSDQRQAYQLLRAELRILSPK